MNALLQVPVDVFNDHDGIIDYKADRNRHSSKRHQVERLIQLLHEKKRDHQGHRDAASSDQRCAQLPQEQEKNSNREKTSEQYCIADTGN